MPAEPFLSRRLTALGCLLLVVVVAVPAVARTQDGGERRRAIELFEGRNFDEALPLLEKLAAASPEDAEVLAKLGIVIVARSVPLTDEAKRRRERARAHKLISRAKELGVKDDFVEYTLNLLNPDGSAKGGRDGFSNNKEAEGLMRVGEAAFSRGDYGAALKAYERAFELDPTLYQAPLFAGDAYLQRKEFEKAAEWYARAVGLQPDAETAYRYWGNALMRQGKHEEAREKYVGAVIAEPYNGYVWRNGLARWAEATRTRLGHPKIEPAAAVTPMKDNKMTITIDPNSPGRGDDGRGAWMSYGISRAAWSVNDHAIFRKAHPAEKEYRHSLAEEAGALRLVAETVKRQRQEGRIKQLAPDLAQLVRLNDEGLLEAFVLFARADDGIARDYAAYRQANRDKLRRYLIEYVTSGKY